ncbi:IclR family transcriptional regulator [Pannonibacter phragmitetus]|uniref:IclR family transcriptional regulator n=1 Tax=Pannonibacter phragmitetus TaxID=121719 RepID=UPI003D2F1D4F
MATPINGSIVKAFAILQLFSDERPEISATTVAAELDTNVPTAHRFLVTLEEVGALVSYRRGYFCLGPAIEGLGRLAEKNDQFATRTISHVRRLADALNESVMVCRLSRRGPACISVAMSKRPISVNIRIGTVLPIETTAQGKIWLADMGIQDRLKWAKQHELPPESELAEIAASGFARNRGENEPEIGALSVPIRDGSGKIAATLSTFGMLNRFDDAMVEAALPKLKAVAEELSAEL